MTGEFAFAHGLAWHGEAVVPLEVEPAPHGWTVHISSEQGGFAVAIDNHDDETRLTIEAIILERLQQ